MFVVVYTPYSNGNWREDSIAGKAPFAGASRRAYIRHESRVYTLWCLVLFLWWSTLMDSVQIRKINNNFVSPCLFFFLFLRDEMDTYLLTTMLPQQFNAFQQTPLIPARIRGTCKSRVTQKLIQTSFCRLIEWDHNGEERSGVVDSAIG